MTSIESTLATLAIEIKNALDSVKDVNKLSNVEILSILESRIDSLAGTQFDNAEFCLNRIGRKVIPYMTCEEIGLVINNKTDKTTLLVNFSDKELMSEMFSRDTNITEHLSEAQAEELLTELLQSPASSEMEEDLTTWVVSNVDTSTLLEQVSEDSLLETVLERCSARKILTAVARSL